MLYLTVQQADLLQGEYSNPPVVVAYSFQVGCMDGDDLAAFAAGFGSTSCECCQADFDGDGDVDGKDLAVVCGKICN